MKKRIVLFIALVLLGLSYYTISSTLDVKEDLEEKVMEYSQSQNNIVPSSIFDLFSVYLK